MNSSRLLGLVLLAGSLFAGYQFYQQAFPPTPCVGPNCPVKPLPSPAPIPPPAPSKPKPWGPGETGSVELLKSPMMKPRRPSPGSITLGGNIGPQGQEVICDLPSTLLKTNISSQGAGCCVFRSIEYCARYQHVPVLYDLPEQMVKANIAGGGYPRKVDDIMKRFAPGVSYLQYEGNSPEVLELAMKTDRMVGVTYNGFDPHYGQRSIAHMICLVYMDKDIVGVRDNNFTSEQDIVWMPREDFMQRWKGNDTNAWAVVLRKPGCAPVPLTK